MILNKVQNTDRKKNKSVYCVDDSNYKNIGGDEYTGKKSPMDRLCCNS